MDAGVDGTVRFFDAIAGRYDRDYAMPSAETRRRMARITELLTTLGSPACDVLVLGVGTGRELPALLDAGHRPTGLDASAAMLEICGKRARPVPLVRASFWEPLPFADGAFDAVLALHGTLSHPPRPDALGALARELARVLRRGAMVVLEVPSPAWLDALPKGERATPEAPLVRVGAMEAEHLDVRTGVGVRARVLGEDAWREAFGADFRVEVEPLGASELRLVARR